MLRLILLGGYYSVSHGLANTVISPYDTYIHNKLSELADYLKLTTSNDSIANKSRIFINSIKKLNKAMRIQEKISDIKERDTPIMAKRALKESHPLYPVLKLLCLDEIINIYNKIKE